MSDATFHSPVLSPLLAALAPEPAEPAPSADDDVVEAYSFNTGAKAMLSHVATNDLSFASKLDLYLHMCLVIPTQVCDAQG